eukprot:4753138-Prymnesium_polylepis.1
MPPRGAWSLRCCGGAALRATGRRLGGPGTGTVSCCLSSYFSARSLLWGSTRSFTRSEKPRRRLRRCPPVERGAATPPPRAVRAADMAVRAPWSTVTTTAT